MNETLVYPQQWGNDGLKAILARLNGKRGHSLPQLLRIRHMPSCTLEKAMKEQQLLLNKLSPYADGFYLDSIDDRWSIEETIAFIQKISRWYEGLPHRKPLLLYIPLDLPLDQLWLLLDYLQFEDIDGVVIGEMITTNHGYLVGPSGKAFTLEKVKAIEERYSERFTVIASGGIHEPKDAVDIIEAGADLVQLHSGLVYSGPGLPKRINEALIYERMKDEAPATEPSFWKSWGWMCLLGLAMIIGGVIAWIIAASSVVLPYDVSFLHMNRTMLMDINDRLLPFMSHDRVTLAGTMISIGVLYFQLGKYGLRYQLHWAKTAVLISNMVGFCSFFLYLGYGYFDPLHAVVAIILLPMFLLAMRGKSDKPFKIKPNQVNDRDWQRAQWGQLMFVILGFALAIGGVVISYIGITHVFVPSDLCYLDTTPVELIQANKNLLPMIAHDRAGFGGALVADAVVLLATALWGIRQGERWLWWTLLVGGFPAFLAGFSVHYRIGYTDVWHLLPAYFAFMFYVVGLLYLYPYLMKKQT